MPLNSTGLCVGLNNHTLNHAHFLAASTIPAKIINGVLDWILSNRYMEVAD